MEFVLGSDKVIVGIKGLKKHQPHRVGSVRQAQAKPGVMGRGAGRATPGALAKAASDRSRRRGPVPSPPGSSVGH